MGKAPAFQFYVKDWLSDPQLRMASFSTRGIWIDLLCFMWGAPERGKLKTNYEKLSKMLGASNGDLDLFFKEGVELEFCDISVTGSEKSQSGHADVTIINRRMYREDNDRRNARLRKQRQREKEVEKEMSRESHGTCHAEITPLSPSPTASALLYKEDFEQFWKAYPLKEGKEYCYKVWNDPKKKKRRPKLKTLIEKINEQKKSRKWTKDGGQYIPRPSTWLNQGCWDDILPMADGKTTKDEYDPRNNPNICRECKRKASSIINGLCLKCKGME